MFLQQNASAVSDREASEERAPSLAVGDLGVELEPKTLTRARPDHRIG